MNLLPLGLLGAGALLLMGPKRSAGREVRGQSMVVVMRLPDGMTQEQLESVMPPGATVQLDGDKAVVTFTAPTSAEITDFETPLGTVHIESARRMSDVVSGNIPPPSYYTFSWWTQKPGTGYVFSGWQAPKKLDWQTMNGAVARARAPQEYVRALMWNGQSWVDPP